MNTILSQKENPNGLHQRYIILKANGEQLDKGSEYFVLRVDKNGGDPIHVAACIAAVLKYAYLIRDHLPQLSTELFERYGAEVAPNIQCAASAVGTPATIKSAFKFKNGRRMIVYTSDTEIKSFECDENWKHAEQPFASSRILPEEKPLDFHLHLRNEVLKPECFVPEHSTNINS